MKASFRGLLGTLLLLIYVLTSVTSQNLCRRFTRGNEVLVDQSLLDDLREEDNSLQEVVQCLESQGNLTFQGSRLEIPLLEIQTAINIQSTVQQDTSITCSDGPLFSINTDGVRISNLEISGCRVDSEAAPVMVRSESSLVLNGVTFVNNANAAGAGVLRMDSDSRLVLEDCTFQRNNGTTANVLAADPGCEIILMRSSLRNNRGIGSTLSISGASNLTISESIFTNNQARGGGGAIKIQSPGERSFVLIENGSEFRNNDALTEEGGAILATGNVNFVIREDTIFAKNSAANQGGALFIRGSSNVNIQDAYFIENESHFLGGGAIFAENSTLGGLQIIISRTLFSKNAARNRLGSGGAIRLQGVGIHCILEDGVSFTSNHAEFDGGAVHVSNVPSMIVRDTTFLGNEVSQGGAAALFVVSTVNVGFDTRVMNYTIEGCLFMFNLAMTTSRGGGTLGFVGARTEVVVTGSRFLDNRCREGSGAAIYSFDGPVVNVSDSSFEDNHALWGGAIYAELDSTFNIWNSSFYRNIADEGGAINTQGTGSLEVVDSQFKNNSASLNGGAVRSENHALSGDVSAWFTFTNNTFTTNNAGYNLGGSAVQSTSNRGGGILIIGQGLYARLNSNTFHNNSASEGGGIAAIRPRQFVISEQSKFEANSANFGGGIFTIVDNSVDIISDFYRINDAQFMNNSASSDGGAIKAITLNSNNDLFPFNADAYTISIEDSIFERNRAIRLGGALAVTGVGIRMQNLSFWNNTAMSVSRSSLVGVGGAVALTEGAIGLLQNSTLVHNQARSMGGAIHVSDAALFVHFTNFSNNSVYRVDANGGALAVLLTSDRLVPRLRMENTPQGVFLECKGCNFWNNSAPLQGGAIYHRHSDPYANYTESWNCENDFAEQLEQYQVAQQYDVTCEWIEAIREHLQSRTILLSRIEFSNNRALSGAALFTNHPAMINITDGEEESHGDTLINTVEREGALEEAGMVFNDNTFQKGGYGDNFASFPVLALLFHEDLEDEEEEGSSTLEFPEFRSGDRLRFEIGFRDAFDQLVKTVANFTGQLIFDQSESDSTALELSGQISSTMDADGRMRFTGTRLEGRSNKSYILRLQFLLRGQDLMMQDPVFVNVTMRACKIGEFTRQQGNVIECINCSAGTFSANASQSKCRSCEKINGCRCLGTAAVPENHYWHASSFSLRMFRCIAFEACSYPDRLSKIRAKEIQAHSEGRAISYKNGTNEQCREGYEGILCGSCEEGYGREGEQCRKCGAKGLRYFVLILLILWSIAFLGYFVRSVVQLSARIEFNKKFRLQHGNSTAAMRAPMEQATSATSNPPQQSTPQIQPGTSSVTMEIEPFYEETNTFPLEPNGQGPLPSRQTSRDLAIVLANRIQVQRRESKIQGANARSRISQSSRGKRQTRLAARIQQIQSNPAMQNAEPLTLGNPVSEVLKILINFLQVTSMAVSINVDWTQAVRRTLLVLGSAGDLAGNSGFFSFDCFLPSSSIPKSLRRMTIAVLYPVFMFLFFTLIFAICTFVMKKSRKYFTQRMWLSLLCITYFFYIGMTKNLLRFFACVKIEEDAEDLDHAYSTAPLEDSYWEEDTSVECYSRRHAFLIGVLVIPLLFAVTIGYPLGTLSILQSNSKLLDDEDFIGTYGFLYRGYDRYYWEVVIMLRKGLIAAVAVFAYGLGENIQGLICVLILVASLGLHLTFSPFTKEIPQLNYLETCSLSTTIAVFVSGLIFNDPKSERETEIVLSVLAILMIVVTVGLLVVSLCSVSEEVIDMLLLENGLMHPDALVDARLAFKMEQLVLHYFGRCYRAGERAFGAVLRRHRALSTESSSTQMATL